MAGRAHVGQRRTRGAYQALTQSTVAHVEARAQWHSRDLCNANLDEEMIIVQHIRFLALQAHSPAPFSAPLHLRRIAYCSSTAVLHPPFPFS
jgi:hypothetical protein